MQVRPSDILGHGGAISSYLEARDGVEGSYEHRPEQLRMSEAVWDAMDARGPLMVEAGTGVGKSFAYLVPAIMRCVAYGERVVVATNTISLQEQLMKKDIPVLEATLDAWGIDPMLRPLRPVLVKGRGNYLSIRRLKLASERKDKLFSDRASVRSLEVIEDWAYSTDDGTKATLPSLEREGVWDHAQSDADNCMGRSCPYHKQCFYQNARALIESGNLFICNHALFFSDMALRVKGTGILPPYDHVILDESHNVEDVASEHLGTALTQGRVRYLMRTLYDLRRRKGYLEQLRMLTGEHEAIDACIHAVLEAGEAAEVYFDAWRQLSEHNGEGIKNGRVIEPKLVDNAMSPALRSLVLRMGRLREAIQLEQDRFELNAYIRRAADMADTAQFFDEQKEDSFAYWVEVSGGGGGGGAQRFTNVRIASSPIEVGPYLNEHLFKESRSVILTSATLATGAKSDEWDDGASDTPDPFAHARRRLGVPACEALLLGSPFDHAAQMEVFIERSVPRPAFGNSTASHAYHDALARHIQRHVTETNGGAFVLFTSFAALYKIADAIGAALEADGLSVYVQGRDGPRGLLLERFRTNERGVLLGAASFWQGVDVRGECLRNVIITRLPFEPPDRPLTQARLDLVAARGGDPFREESLPRAIIRFKQGVGRLIRSHTDAGRVVVLDPRIVTAGYGRSFLRALPSGIELNAGTQTESDHT